MKAILIDPAAKTVSELELAEPYDYKQIYEHGKFGCFDCISLPGRRGDVIYVDDEGLMNIPRDKHDNVTSDFFVVLAPHGASALNLVQGRGILLGTDDAGESKSPDVTADIMRPFIKFIPEHNREKAAMLAERIVNLTGVMMTPEDVRQTQDKYIALMEEAMELTK